MAGSLLMPVLSHGLAGKADVRPLLGTAARLIVTPMSVIAITAATYPHEILRLLYDNPSGEAATSLVFLMAALAPLSITFIYSTLLTSAGNIRSLGIITAVAAMVSVTLNLIVVPRLSVGGAALTALITWTGVAVASGTVAARRYGTGLTSGHLLSFLAVVATAVTAGILLRMTSLPWYVAALLQAASAGASALALRLVDPLKGINMLLRGK